MTDTEKELTRTSQIEVDLTEVEETLKEHKGVINEIGGALDIVEEHMKAMTVVMEGFEKRVNALEELVKTLSNRD